MLATALVDKPGVPKEGGVSESEEEVLPADEAVVDDTV
jgi:hypothetical protein